MNQLGLFAYMRDPLRFLKRQFQRCGDVARFRLGLQNIFQISDPAMIQDILNRDYESFEKTGALRRFEPIIGQGLLTSEGAFHKQQRRLAQPAFSQAQLKGYGDLIPAIVDSEADRWNDGRPFDMAEAMNRMCLQIAGRTLFGANLSSETPALTRAVSEVFDNVNRLLRPFAFVWSRLPLPSNFRAKKAMAFLKDAVRRVVADHRANQNNAGANLLSVYLETAAAINGKPLTDDKQICDEVMTFLLAGHETVATTLSWTWYLLAKNPEVEKRLAEEIRNVCGERIPTFEDLQNLDYTERVLKEAMRMVPPVWNLSRRLKTDYQAGSVFIPAGSIVGMSQYLVHNDERWFANPTVFDPNRWLPDEVAKRPRYSYFPFGGGPRGCIGAAFAMVEAKLILATLIRRFHFSLKESGPVSYRALITIRPTGGIAMDAQKRAVSVRF